MGRAYLGRGLIFKIATPPTLSSVQSAGTRGYFRSWGQTGCAIRLPATAALDPKRTSQRASSCCAREPLQCLDQEFWRFLRDAVADPIEMP